MKQIVLGVFAQVDAGKTTLCEALLYRTGQVKKLGRVDHGDAFLDHHPLERNRGITIFSKEARITAGQTAITLLDTPGHVDFSPEAERCMGVLDYALLIINGTDGVQGHTRTLWKLLQRYEIPTILFFNKMDLPGSDRAALLQDGRKHLSPACHGLEDEESIALCDEAALEAYLETGQIPPDLLAKMIRSRQFFPCLFGSALRLEGVEELLHTLDRLTLPKVYPPQFSARVYKVARDAQGNRLTFLKVTGGSLKVRSLISYQDREGVPLQEKVTQLRLYSGSGFVQTEEVFAGSVCAVTGLSGLCAGDCPGEETPLNPPLLTPVMTYRIGLPSGADPALVLPKLRQLEEEEPQLRILWDEGRRQIHAQLMGQVQIEVLESLIRERFQLEVTIDERRVAYRETIAARVEGVGHFEPLRHYAEVHLLLEPLPRGSGLVFASCCSEDALERNWQRLILTHLQEKTHLGVLTGAPITDIKITLAAGRAHIKHTEGGDFRQATYRAVRQGLLQAESVLLEPYYRFQLYVPPAQIGRAINDIRAMGGKFSPPEETEGMMCLEGTAPISKMQDYMQELIAYTHGHGKLFCENAGYDLCQDPERVIRDLAYDPLRDVENTGDSVFCSHGAGVTVPWDQVFSAMHLESVLEKPTQELPSPAKLRRQALDSDEKELEAIIAREFGPEKRILHRPPRVTSTEHTELPPVKKKYLIVDGYNMIFAWEGLRELAQTDLAGAREQLLDLLSNYCGYVDCTLVVVFDSYRVKGGIGSRDRCRNLRVVYTKENESADLYIESLLAQIGRNYTVRVASSDGLIQLAAFRSGVLRVSAQELYREIQQTDEQIAALIAQLRRKHRRDNILDNPLRELSKEVEN